MDLFLIPDKYRRWIPLLLSIISGGIGAIMGWIAFPLFPMLSMPTGFVLGSLGMILFISLIAFFFSLLSDSITNQFNFLFKQLHETEGELRSMINIRPLLGQTLVPFGEWSIDGRFGEKLIRLLLEERPGLVLECGSGTSTVLAAQCLNQIGSGRIVALEHLGKFAAATRQRLREGRLENIATVLETPLREWSLNGINMSWYNFKPAAHLHQQIDLLIVDGPPGNTGHLARYPALPILKEWLSPGGIILLDDGNRDDEREIAERWIKELNTTSEFLPAGKGAWIIRK